MYMTILIVIILIYIAYSIDRWSRADAEFKIDILDRIPDPYSLEGVEDPDEMQAILDAKHNRN